MNIILIGYRGAGKTSVAKELKKITGAKVFSTDDAIGDVTRFVKKRGWDTFRDKEEEIIRSLDHKGIVDCGGGVIEREANITALRSYGAVFWLKASPDKLRRRMGSRPALTSKNAVKEISEVLERRTPLYQRCADYVIDTEGKSAKNIAKEVIRRTNQARICVTLTESTVQGTSDAMRAADLIELRLDLIKDIDVEKLRFLLVRVKKKVIVTCRTHKKKFELLQTAIDARADYIDVEHDYPRAKELLDQRESTKVIVSYHDHKRTGTLEDLSNIYDKIKLLQPDMVKIVTNAKSINDNFTIFELLKGKDDLIAFCMGEKGEISRVLALKYGTITYARHGPAAAPGQLSMEEMEQYNCLKMHSKTDVYGVIGSHAEKSISKYLFNPLFDATYLPFKVEEAELKAFMENFRAFGFKGASVTIPHKVNVMKLLDKIDGPAKRIGAVNTITSKNGLLGSNTDWTGAIRALGEPLKNKKVLVIGAGGAARAIVYGLKQKRARVTVMNRTAKKAKALSAEFRTKYDELQNIGVAIEDNEIVINATSVGMLSAEAIVENLFAGKTVMDVVYRPGGTKLLQIAKGCRTIRGEKMLVEQATEQYRLWTGEEADIEMMESALDRVI